MRHPLSLLAAAGLLVVEAASAQPSVPPLVPSTGPSDLAGASEILRAPGGAPAPGGARAVEIFPDASRVWMSVRVADPLPIERARRGGAWLCASGQCALASGDPGPSKVGDEMLRSIKLSTSSLPLPLTLWGPTAGGGKGLDFDPSLITRRSYAHVCAYGPVDPAKQRDKVLTCQDGTAEQGGPDSGEIALGLEWPGAVEQADFKYVAIVDACGNARVQPFQKHFTVPVTLASTGACGAADGRVLRVFPHGTSVRVTGFNLEAPARGNVVHATYRVTVPPLEATVESSPVKMLFPDIQSGDLVVDCGPSAPKALPDPTAAPPGRQPPHMVDPDAPDKAPPNKPPPAAPDKAPPPRPDKGPGPQPLSHGAAVISPDPLRQGSCKVRLTGPSKGRLVAPLALHVSLKRTDKSANGAPLELIRDGLWVVTPSDAELAIPALNEGFDGDSRLSLTVSSDPLSQNGKLVLLSDAGRVARALKSSDPGEPDRARRTLGSLVIHSVPLCGQSNFEPLLGKGSCFRAYITIPAILGMIQLTRAPWMEKPLITRNVLSAVGAALAFDAYSPVERKAFPIAAQVGGLFENLGDGKLGVLGYVGVAPTFPVLGAGGNTTSIGLLGGVGLAYVINEKGPDEGVKPAAFLSVLVSVGQASPWAKP